MIVCVETGELTCPVRNHSQHMYRLILQEVFAMPTTIDGDAHVMEGPQTWEYCDPSERKFMPVLLNPGPDADRQFWLVDGKIRGHVRHVIKPKDFHALAQASGRDMVVPPEAQ